MARLRSSLLGIFVLGALLGTACGEDTAPAKGGGSSNDDDDDEEDDNTSKKDAGKDAGKATDAGKKDAGAAAAASVECGSKTCTGTMLMDFSSKPCCFDEEEELCSVYPLTGGDVCPAPAVENENCPTVTIFGQTPKACCTADNHCGIDATMLGMGCADLASPTLAMLPGVTLPPPQTCDGEPLEPTTPPPVDAGTPSTGDAGKADAGKSDAGAATDAGRADAGRDAGR